jgi:hypothetical protein
VRLPYDTLVVAAGATHAYFGRGRLGAVAPGMKTVEDARHLRSHILTAFEMAELCDDPAERAEWLTFVVVGAGPTGVELVGQVAELAHEVLPRGYRTVDTTEARIILLEGAGAVLGPFDPKLQNYAAAQLARKGVDIRLNTMAVAMDDASVTVKGPDGEERILARTRIWAAGVQASPLARKLAEATSGTLDRAGRVAVNPDCTLPNRPEVFAIGDMVSLNDPSRRGPAGDPGRQVRRKGDQGPARRLGRGGSAVPVLRQGHDGDDRSQQCGGPRRSAAGTPAGSPISCGSSSTSCTSSAGATDSARSTLDAWHGVRAQPRTPPHHVRAGARRDGAAADRAR